VNYRDIYLHFTDPSIVSYTHYFGGKYEKVDFYNIVQ